MRYGYHFREAARAGPRSAKITHVAEGMGPTVSLRYIITSFNMTSLKMF